VVFRSFAEGKNKTLVKILGVVNTGRPLQVKYWGRRDPYNPCGVDACAWIVENQNRLFGTATLPAGFTQLQ